MPLCSLGSTCNLHRCRQSQKQWSRNLRSALDFLEQSRPRSARVPSSELGHHKLECGRGVRVRAAQGRGGARVQHWHEEGEVGVGRGPRRLQALQRQGGGGHPVRGQQGILGDILKKQGVDYVYGSARLENRAQLEDDIDSARPTHVFNAAGVTGRPNVDWCESHKTETIRANVVGVLTLADVCRQHGLLLVSYATWCIFEYDAAHPEGSGIGQWDRVQGGGHSQLFRVLLLEDQGDGRGASKNYDNVCTLRVRMPITSDLKTPRNFITKIARYEKVVNIPNNMTVLDELLPISIEMAKRNLRGIWNFTNPRVVSHNEVLDLYREYIDPSFKYTNFTLEEQAKVIVAARSNNETDASKLKKEFPELMDIKQSLIKIVFQPNRQTPVRS